MARRYGRRTGAGTYEYYDSKADMEAVQRNEDRTDREIKFAIFGLFIGGFLAYAGIEEFGLSDWPKIARFFAIVVSAIAGAAAGALLSEFIWRAFLWSLGFGILIGIGIIIWKLA